MSDRGVPLVAVVDYGLGNLYSVKRACEHAGLRAEVMSRPEDLLVADAVVLPGVGAMPEAMHTLETTGLADAIRTTAGRGTPILGVCLGMQLLMEHGSEFSRHSGLGLVPGNVVRFEAGAGHANKVRVPHIGWDAVHHPDGNGISDAWKNTPLEGSADGVHMYFVHSYYVVPADATLAVAWTEYGGVSFCSGLSSGNVFGCQFHPERSGPSGLALYERFAQQLAAC